MLPYIYKSNLSLTLFIPVQINVEVDYHVFEKKNFRRFCTNGKGISIKETEFIKTPRRNTFSAGTTQIDIELLADIS